MRGGRGHPGTIRGQDAARYLIGEKLLNFMEASQTHPEWAAELPHFAARTKELFAPHEIVDDAVEAGEVLDLPRFLMERIRKALRLRRCRHPARRRKDPADRERKAAAAVTARVGARAIGNGNGKPQRRASDGKPVGNGTTGSLLSKAMSVIDAELGPAAGSNWSGEIDAIDLQMHRRTIRPHRAKNSGNLRKSGRLLRTSTTTPFATLPCSAPPSPPRPRR